MITPNADRPEGRGVGVGGGLCAVLRDRVVMNSVALYALIGASLILI